MKRLPMTLMALAVAVMPFLFASCDDDDWDDDNPWDNGFNWHNPWWYSYDNGDYDWNSYYDNDRNDNSEDQILAEAQALNGEWRGTMQYASAKDQQTSKFDCDMTFTQYSQNSVNGTGIEVDAADSEPQTLQFKWYIDEKNGDIYIKYDSGSTFVMDAQANQKGFSLKEGDYFDGYMLGTNTNDMAYIELDRVTENDTRAATNKHRSFGSTSLLKPKMNAVEKLVKR